MKELFVDETPTVTASNPPAATPAATPAAAEPAKKKADEMTTNPAYIIVPAILGGIIFIALLVMAVAHFMNRR
jgi:hypothetical protein